MFAQEPRSIFHSLKQGITILSLLNDNIWKHFLFRKNAFNTKAITPKQRFRSYNIEVRRFIVTETPE